MDDHGGSRGAPEAREHLPAMGVREVEVEDDEGGRGTRDGGDGLSRGAARLDDAAERCERRHQAVALGRVVLDDEDATAGRNDRSGHRGAVPCLHDNDHPHASGGNR